MLKLFIYLCIFIGGILGIATMVYINKKTHEKMPQSFWAYVAWVAFVEIIAFVLYFVIF